MLDLQYDGVLLWKVKCSERVYQSQMCYHKFLPMTMIVFVYELPHGYLTMQYYKRTGELKDETLSCSLKDKPFGFKNLLHYEFYLLSTI